MTASQMRAVLFDEPAPDVSTTRVGEMDMPTPGSGEVVIRVSYAGVNFKDVMARRGDPGYVRAWPFIPGLEVAGTVQAIGENVHALAVGQPVVALTGEAGLAEFAAADARLTVPLPAGATPSQAAGVAGAPLTAALLVNDFGHLQAGESVLVHSAAGAVGHAVAQFARLAGAALLIGTVGHASRIEAAQRNGYDPVLVRGSELAATVGAAAVEGVDLILDPQGTATLDLDLQVASPGARIVVFGNATGTPLGPLPALGQLMGANISLRGFSLAALAAKAPARLATTLTSVLDQLADGSISVDVTVLDGLEAAADAQQALAEGRGDTKYVIHVDGRTEAPASLPA
jgi:NADPH2:quinone reductase